MKNALMLCLAFGCTAPEGDGTLADDIGADEASAGKADAPSIAFSTFDDPALVPSSTAVHKVFTSQAGYSAFFGHKAPGIDFRSDWVVYYDAGKAPTGAGVSVDRITKSATGLTLKVAVAVTPSCSGVPNTPYALVRLHKQPGATLSRFTTDAVAEFCDPCAAVRCAAGTHCAVEGTTATCASDGITCDIDNRCPGNGSCIPRTWDSCTPNKPGCTGVCSCTGSACPAGEHFDASVGVCACAPGLACGDTVCAPGLLCCQTATSAPACATTCP
jgi:hypothetical protein